MNNHEIWWKYVSGSSMFVKATTDALCSGKNVCLCVPDSLPWRDTFFDHVAVAVREFESDISFEEVRSAKEEPGKYLVEHFGLDSEYRPTKKYEDFLRENRAFADRVMRVSATENTAQCWFEFEKKYKTSSVHDGLILLDTRSVLRDITSPPRHVSVIDYDDFISEYDALVFAELLITNNKMNIEQKRYLAALAISLFGSDAEKVADFVNSFRIEHDDPERLTNWNGTIDSLPRHVWRAQVQTLFPLIMRECREFIDTWQSRIDDAFLYADNAFPDGLLGTDRVRIVSSDEMELSTIRYLMRTRRRDANGSETESYILYIPDERVRSRIDLLYSMRNQIAHGRTCSVNDVTQLLTSIR